MRAQNGTRTNAHVASRRLSVALFHSSRRVAKLYPQPAKPPNSPPQKSSASSENRRASRNHSEATRSPSGSSRSPSDSSRSPSGRRSRSRSVSPSVEGLRARLHPPGTSQGSPTSRGRSRTRRRTLRAHTAPAKNRSEVEGDSSGSRTRPSERGPALETSHWQGSCSSSSKSSDNEAAEEEEEVEAQRPRPSLSARERYLQEMRLRAVLQGQLKNLPELCSKVVRIFTSSTFTDTSLERNALMTSVYPELQEYCRRVHGVSFQVVDMRWGVRDEATDDHLTSSLCLKELDSCKRLSIGPNFVSLLGQKYGYRPFPPEIEATEFEELRLRSNTDDRILLDRWFKKDTNNIPPLYVLQPISSILSNYTNKRCPKLMARDQNTWWEMMTKLQDIFRRAANQLFKEGKMNAAQRHNYFMSVTEREVDAGVLQADDPESHVFCISRTITNINVRNKNARLFTDLIGDQPDEEAQELLSALKSRLTDVIPKCNVISYKLRWTGENGVSAANDEHQKYVEQFCTDFFEKLKDMIDKGMRKIDPLHWNPLYVEVLQHLHVAEKVCKKFRGRVDMAHHLLLRAADPTNRAPLVVYGKSGCGKTSLMAKMIQMAAQWWPKTESENEDDDDPAELVVVCRFLGSSSDSTAVLPMLTSVCRQICQVYRVHPQGGVPTNDISQLGIFFRQLFRVANAKRPLLVLLDSIDQLVDTDGAHLLTWLPTHLPPHTALIVTTLTDFNDILSTLRQKLAFAPEENFVVLDQLGSDVSESMLRSWLREAKRDVTDEQWAVVRQAVSHNNLPLYIRLLFDEIVSWRSYQPVPRKPLVFGVRETIHRRFALIEKRHGHLLVTYGFAFLTLARNGLSQSEVEDLLSQEDRVLNDVFQYHVPPIRRIPPLLWTRIRSDLEGFLTEREVDGISVLSWYHRQLHDVAKERYLRNANFRKEVHSTMADYFLGRWAGVPKPFRYDPQHLQRGLVTTRESSADRHVQPQPLVFGGGRPNLRRLNELPHHLLRAGRVQEYDSHCIFNLAFLQAKVSAMPLSSLLQNLKDILDYHQQQQQKRREEEAGDEVSGQQRGEAGIIEDKDTRILMDTLRLSVSTITRFPDALASQIVGRLLPYYPTCPRIRHLIDQCDTRGGLLPSFPAFHTPGGPLEFTLEGHDFAPFGLAVTAEERYLVSGSSEIIVCDLHTGDTLRTTRMPNLEGLIQGLAPSKIFSDLCVGHTNRNQIVIYQVTNGDFRIFENAIQQEELLGCALQGEGREQQIVAWSSKRIVVFSLDGKALRRRRIRAESGFQITEVVLAAPNRCQVILSSEESDLMVAVGEAEEEAEEEEDGDEVRVPFHSGLAFSSDLLQLFACTDINSNSIFHLKRTSCGAPWMQQAEMENSDDVFSLALSPDHTLLLASLQKGYKLWRLDDPGPAVRLRLPSDTRNLPARTPRTARLVVFTAGNQHVVTATFYNLFVFSAASGALLKRLKAHFGRILRLIALPKRDRLVSCAVDHKISVWNVKNLLGRVFHVLKMERPITELRALPEVDLCLVRTRNAVALWSTQTGRVERTFRTAEVGGRVQAVDISPDGSVVLVLGNEALGLWRGADVDVVAKTPVPNGLSIALYGQQNRCLVTCRLEHYTDYELQGLRLPSLQTVFRFNLSTPSPLVPAAVCAPRRLLAAVTDGRLEMRHALTGKLLWHLALPSPPRGLRFLPRETPVLAIVTEKGVQLCDVRRRTLGRFIDGWNGVSTSDGRLGIYAPNRGGLELIDLSKRPAVTCKVLIPKVAEGVFTNKVLFTPDDRYVAYNHLGHRTVRLFRVEDGECLGTFRCAAPITDIAAVQRQLVIGQEDAGITFVSIADPKFPDSLEHLRALPSRHVDLSSSMRHSRLHAQLGRSGSELRFPTAAHLVHFVTRLKGKTAQSRACSVS